MRTSLQLHVDGEFHDPKACGTCQRLDRYVFSRRSRPFFGFDGARPSGPFTVTFIDDDGNFTTVDAEEVTFTREQEPNPEPYLPLELWENATTPKPSQSPAAPSAITAS